ncbi:MAG TPA: biotin/lipoate A/B protein ligase family protein [Baekduia sp.]|nr:biotin/lipoate A/B protein ligase family protein [Baekduia sp.]
MSVWRVLTEDEVEPAEGLALDEALMTSYGRATGGTVPGVAALRLYTYRSHAALVGRHQSLEAEVDLAACERLGVGVGRRPTGGGAIIMGEGQLGVAVATRAPVDCSPRELLQAFGAGVAAGLAELGIAARFRGKNDLECGGRKIAGLGLHLDGDGALLFHASVLADLDVDLLLDVLRIPGAKLAAHGAARVQERITTVSRELGRPVTGADLRGPVRRGMAAALGVELRDDVPTATELDVAALHAGRHRSPDWLHIAGGSADTHASVLLRTPQGLLRIYAGVQGTALTSVMVTGDVAVLPPSVTRAEALLRWLPAEPDVIADALRECVEPDVLGVGPDVLAAGVWAAARQAMERSGSLPVRLSGSCYFPDPAGAAPAEPLAVGHRA